MGWYPCFGLCSRRNGLFRRRSRGRHTSDAFVVIKRGEGEDTHSGGNATNRICNARSFSASSRSHRFVTPSARSLLLECVWSLPLFPSPTQNPRFAYSRQPSKWHRGFEGDPFSGAGMIDLEEACVETQAFVPLAVDVVPNNRRSEALGVRCVDPELVGPAG